MNKQLIPPVVLIAILLAGFAMAQGRPNGYPFDVKIGGQPAVVIKDWFARIPTPISADAEIEAVGQTVSDTMFVNIFKSDAEANVDPANNNALGIIMVNGTNKAKLNQTLSKQPLPAGTYLANIMANNQTSRVVFVIK